VDAFTIILKGFYLLLVEYTTVHVCNRVSAFWSCWWFRGLRNASNM